MSSVFSAELLKSELCSYIKGEVQRFNATQQEFKIVFSKDFQTKQSGLGVCTLKYKGHTILIQCYEFACDSPYLLIAYIEGVKDLYNLGTLRPLEIRRFNIIFNNAINMFAFKDQEDGSNFNNIPDVVGAWLTKLYNSCI